MLSRVTWPPFSTKRVIEGIKAAVDRRLIARVCVQAMNYRGVVKDLVGLVKEVRSTTIPISVSCQPLTRQQINRFSEVGVDRICIPLDLPTKELFEQVKGTLAGAPYRWERHLEALEQAIHVFGRGRVSTHLIVGLGESDKELTEMFQVLVDMGVYPSLFAFTPIPGTRMAERSQPPIQRYRKIQIAHHLITTGMARIEQMEFDANSNLIGFGVTADALMTVVRSGLPFMTSGCPGCNRPYYNERPGGPIYNFPRKPNMDEITRIERQLTGV